jgi:prepilin-type N-terminal cleavage/methylation domain-containing protein
MTEQKQHQNLSQSRDGGYTIIESLVAMIVVSVLMIAIAPVMAFSVATRVQARRVELATQAARAYIDALRTGAIVGPKPGPAGKGFPSSFTGDVTSANPPVPSASSDTNLYCVDLDGLNCKSRSSSSNRAFYVQGAWQNTSNPAPTDPTTTGYPLLVRVYRGDAAFGSLTAQQQSVAGSGIGNPKAPVVVMQTEIPPTTAGGASAYRSLCDRTPNGCK